MTIKSIEVRTIAQICYVAVSVLREAASSEAQPAWEEVDAQAQGVITDYVVAVLSGRSTPDTHEGMMISRICHQFSDPKKTLKYA